MSMNRMIIGSTRLLDLLSDQGMVKRSPTDNNSSKDCNCGGISSDIGRRWPEVGIPFPDAYVSLMIQRGCAVDMSCGWSHGRRAKGAARWEGKEMGGLFGPLRAC